MVESRAERWQRVMRGEEKLTWELWSSPVRSSQVLSETGMDVVETAIQRLKGFFGPDFLHECMGKDHPLLSMDLMPGNDVRNVYLGLISLDLHVQLLGVQPNFRDVRKALKSDKSLFGWGHALVQLEVAGLALRDGWLSEFEPSLPTGRSADVAVYGGGTPLIFEIVQMGTDESFRATGAFNDRMNRLLTHLCMERSVSIPGECSRIASDTEIQHLVDALEARSEGLRGLGNAFTIRTEWGAW